jgi:hypothetical protein
MQIACSKFTMCIDYKLLLTREVFGLNPEWEMPFTAY